MDRTLALALLCLLAAPVFAGDKEAIQKYNEALGHWNDPDPAAST